MQSFLKTIPAIAIFILLTSGSAFALSDAYNSMFKFFLAELWQVAINGTPQGLWVGHREGM